MTAPPRVFDRTAWRRHRQRAAAADAPLDFLHAEVADRLVERLEDLRRPLPVVLALGSGGSTLRQRLAGRFGIELLVGCDAAEGWARRGEAEVVADEELLPFGQGRFDAVLGGFSLHWANDLPGILAQASWALKPDGLLLLAFPGGETLIELRQALLDAELEVAGGASPRVSPFTQLVDAAGLLQRAGLALPVADSDRITVTYGEPWKLLAELRAMGEGNALALRSAFLRRDVLGRAMQLYRERWGDADGRVPATFEILFLTGWRAAAGQPKPLPRGSGKVSLAEALAPPKRD